MNIRRPRLNLFENPFGLGERTPEFSWELTEANPGSSRQMAYRILVAETVEDLLRGKGDLWDSGRVKSAQSTYIRYEGKPLQSRMKCHWRVIVWDESGASSVSETSHWTVGLLESNDWRAYWIGLETPPEYPIHPLPNSRWIWAENTQPGRVHFEKTFELAKASDGYLWGLADDMGEVEINGQPICDLPRAQGGYNLFPLPLPVKVTALKKGPNRIVINAQKRTDRDPHAGVILRLAVGAREISERIVEHGVDLVRKRWEGGFEIVTDHSWTCLREGVQATLRELGSFGISPWHLQSPIEYPNLRARYLRREFTVSGPISSATLYFSGLGLSEAWLNGERIGDEALSPHATDYHKSVYYRAFDITPHLAQGANAVGCILGNGRYFAPRARIPFPMEHYGSPKLLLQLEIQYADGRSERIVSDTSWKVSTHGAIGWNNEFDGEEYDARRDDPAWSQPGFADRDWTTAQLVAQPMGQLQAQVSDPIRAQKEFSPQATWMTKYGTRIFDFGVNLVGWCKGAVTGKEGDILSLHHAETMESPHVLATENLRSALCTDTVLLKEGETRFEPKFTYHGFRYVEARGPVETLELKARFVHDDVAETGSFHCSNELVNRIVDAAARGIRGNYRSVPTDCPQRDERMGWLGDRAGGAPGEMFLFDISKLYRKWMDDIRLAQADNGCVPDVVPPYWRMYSDNVTWPSCVVFIPYWLHRHYGDTSVVERNFEAITRWVEHLSTYLSHGLLNRDIYGDWCVPPESPHLIHSARADRKTAPAILASTYLAKNLELAAQLAELVGQFDLAKSWRARRSSIAEALNATYFNSSTGSYDNGSQTASLLPLAFGLTPENNRRQVFETLVAKITESGQPVLGTGLVGGQWLLRTLTAYGRPDLAAALVMREEYPGWGYMIRSGATTIWELWNGDSADPLMNSGNHVMLLGDLLTWLYEDVAGIQPGRPGFEQIVLRPHFVFQSVLCRHQSIRGYITSSWKVQGKHVLWEITLPPNSTAEVQLPASVRESLRENQQVESIIPCILPESPFAWVKFQLEPGHHLLGFRLPTEFPMPGKVSPQCTGTEQLSPAFAN